MKYGLIGFKGKMGREIIEVFKDHNLVLKVDADVIEEIDRPDVIVDFSSPSALQKTLELSKKYSCGLVVGTTGLTAEQLESLKERAKEVPVVYSTNYSKGIDLVKRLLEVISKELSSWEVSIVEKHHNQKKDAPSGTAISLSQVLGGTIEIHSLRLGGIFGDHTVILANEGEVIEITHRAISRKVFALGALTAAQFVCNAKPGFYSFREVLENSR